MLTPNTLLQNRYRIIRLLGQGGMGAVYQAQDLRLNQIVALKENIGGEPRQFQQEALLLANLRHPNLPRVSDHFVEPNGAQYLVMDFVEGEDLQSRLDRQGALPEAQVLAWFDQILDAVAYLHSRGVIHRDIKPANIKITPAGQAVLVDFGIAKVYQPGQRTQSGAKAATPGFAAPEQYSGGTDQRSDIYSLGSMLYALLVGYAPPDALAMASGVASLTPPRRLNPALSAGVESAILRALTVQPSQRFQTADEMRRALSSMHVSPTVLARQPTSYSSATVPTPQPMLRPSQLAAPRMNKNNAVILALVAGVGLLVLLGIGGVIWGVSSVSATPTLPAVAALDTKTPTATLTRVIPTGTMILQTLVAPVTPSALPTLAATATPPALPPLVAPPTPPALPTSTAAPTASIPPVPLCATAAYFQNIWEGHKRLGCPANSSTSDFTFQKFETGLTLWRKSPTPSTIYALFYDNRRWETKPDPGGPETPPCPEASQTGFGPIRGFGTLWCQIWKSDLGQPLAGEQDGKNNPIQNFDNGTVLTVGAAGGFIIYSDSSWEPF